MPIAPIGAATSALASTAGPAHGTFGAALRARAPRPAFTATAPPASARTALAAVEHARERLDAVVDAARRGRTFTPQELLALQADAYRYSQTLDVAARLVEHAAQSVRQAVNTQV